MENFEKEVDYFVNLIMNNVQIAKTKKGKKAREESIFYNINVRIDGKEILVWDMEKDYAYNLYTKEIEDYNPHNCSTNTTKYLALYYIDKLTKYQNNEITFEELVGIRKEPKPVVKNLIEQKKNISEQLKLLRSNRNIPEVQEYVDSIYNDKYASEYVRYLIDTYYYNKKDLIRPKKNGLERMGKLLLR